MRVDNVWVPSDTTLAGTECQMSPLPPSQKTHSAQDVLSEPNACMKGQNSVSIFLNLSRISAFFLAARKNISNTGKALITRVLTWRTRCHRL